MANQKKWKARFQQLMEYKRVHGNCNVPRHYKANKQLGGWVSKQRTKEETMSEERRKRLNSIGFVWKVQNIDISDLWKVRFQQLVDYKQVHRDCNVPQRYKPNPQLGTWVNTQRRTKEETMIEEKQKILDSIGFVWRLTAGRPKQQRQVRPLTVEGPKKKKIKLDDEAAQEDKDFGHEAWDSYFKQLCEFVKTYKHCNVPLNSIQSWDDGQRSSDNCTSGSKLERKPDPT